MDREAFRALVQRLVALPTIYEDQPVPIIAPLPTFAAAMPFAPTPGVDSSASPLAAGSNGQGLATITITPRAEAASWTTWTYDQVADARVATTQMQHGAMVSVRIETYGTLTAGEVGERLRLRLRFASTIAALDALGIAFVVMQPLVRLPQTRDNRVTQVAVLDFAIAYVTYEVDAMADPNYIATADVTGDVT